MTKQEVIEETVRLWSAELRNVDDKTRQQFEDELFSVLVWRLSDKAWDRGNEIAVSCTSQFGKYASVAYALKRCGLTYQNSTLSMTTFLSKQGVRVSRIEL